MTREEYLAQLRALLTGRTPPDELERILAYYTEYFDEAGPQGEGRVIRELGTSSISLANSSLLYSCTPPKYFDLSHLGKKIVEYLLQR